MITPAFRISRFRSLFLGLGASACGALCLATPACGGDGGSSPSQNTPLSGAPGAAGSPSGAGGMNPGGGAPAATAGSAGTSTAGVSAGGTTGGTAGAAGAAAGGGGMAGAATGGSATGPLGGTEKRPELSAADADRFTILKYLEKNGVVGAPTLDAWDPTAGVGDVTALTPKYTVEAGGTYVTVQSAIDKAVADGGTERIAIEVKPGTYREVVCVPSAAPPITLFSKTADASATKIVFNNYNGKAKTAETPANPCNPAIGALTYGTSGSPTFAAWAKGFQAKNLTFENDTDETGITENVQAVALATQGDRQIYENVRLLGNQDTFFVKSPAADTIARVFVTKSFIQGDTDFIFGRGTLVIDQSEIRFISSRQGSKGYAIVPSTDARNPYGILVNKCTFTADEATTPGTIHLGRAWDESGKDVATYLTLVATGIYPNGQALVRESTLGAHIRLADPWAEAATTKRPYSSVAGAAPANRMWEFANTGPGAAVK
jgi:pectinesterase